MKHKNPRKWYYSTNNNTFFLYVHVISKNTIMLLFQRTHVVIAKKNFKKDNVEIFFHLFVPNILT